MGLFPSTSQTIHCLEVSGRVRDHSVGRCGSSVRMGSDSAEASRAGRRQIDTLRRNRRKYEWAKVTSRVR